MLGHEQPKPKTENQQELDLTVRKTYGDFYVDAMVIDTSSAKFNEMDKSMNVMHNNIIALMLKNPKGLTPMEMQVMLRRCGIREEITSIRPPMTILKKSGVLIDSGVRRDKQYVLQLAPNWDTCPIPETKKSKNQPLDKFTVHELIGELRKRWREQPRRLDELSITTFLSEGDEIPNEYVAETLKDAVMFADEWSEGDTFDVECFLSLGITSIEITGEDNDELKWKGSNE